MSNAVKCPVCSRDAGIVNASRVGKHYQCPSCGEFALSFGMVPDNGNRIEIDGNVCNKIGHLLCERRIRKLPPIMIVGENETVANGSMSRMKISEIHAMYPQRFVDYFDRCLENLSYLLNHPVAFATVKENDRSCLFSQGDQGIEMLRRIADLKYITLTNGETISFLPEGWKRVNELQYPGRNSKQGFVAMWFHDTQVAIYDDAIKPAIEQDGRFNAFIMNRSEHNDRIDDAMIAEIRRSRFMVSDFNDQRQNVYFEAGFALGLGLPVIWTVHENYSKALHFDTRQYNHITYSGNADLKEKLYNRIRATIA